MHGGSAFFIIGIGVGLLIALPVAWLYSRRTARRLLALQDRTQRAERLAEIGSMTGGLAHEIRNPLSTIGLNIQLLQEDLADTQRSISANDTDKARLTNAPDGDLEPRLERVKRRLDGLYRETQRLRDILEDFLQFAGRLQLHREPQDVHRLLEELADFFAPQADDAGVRIRLDLQANPHVAAVDAALLKQALLNLMLNATQAMSQDRERDTGSANGGNDELHLRTWIDHTPARSPRVTRRPDPTPRLCIDVTDTGPGIPTDVRPRIFEPYFSRKRGGTGLGLPTTKRIVEEHGGSLAVHSEAGRGTRFTLSLPMSGSEIGRGVVAE
jgi:signal transduction histidine kinase